MHERRQTIHRKTIRYKNRFQVILFLVLVSTPLAFAAVGNEIPRFSGRFIVDTWTVNDGLPQDTIQVMHQCRTGYIWLGTPLGLVRFDGNSFKVFNRWNTPALGSESVLSIYEGKSGELWIGTGGGGLVHLEHGKWAAYTKTHGLSDNTVPSIAGNGSGFIWVGTHNGLNRLHRSSDPDADRKITTFSMQDGLNGHRVTALAIDLKDRLWIGTDYGLNVIHSQSDGNTRITDVPFFPHIEVTSLFMDSMSVLWIGTENGLFRLDDSELQPGGKFGMISRSTVTALTEHTRGELWIGTYGEGLYRLKNGSLHLLSGNSRIPGQFIHALLKDSEGNIWSGTYTSGLVRVKTATVETLTTTNGLPEPGVTAAMEDQQGNLWIGTERNGLVQTANRKVVRHWTTADGLAGNRIRVIYQDPDQNIWVGTRDNGLTLLQYVNGNYRASLSYNSGHGLLSQSVTAVFRDKNGTVWTGTDKGLYYRFRANFKEFAPGFQLEGRHIHAVVPGIDGHLMVAARGGIYRTGEATVKQLVDGYDILSLSSDQNKQWWAGTNGNGLLLLLGLEDEKQPVRVKRFTTFNGLPDNYVFSITRTPWNDFWFSSYHGVYRIAGSHLESRDAPESPFLPVMLFDQGEGMPASRCAMTGRPAACLTRSGQLAIPTVKGLAIFNPSTSFSTPEPPLVKIEQVIADNKPLSIHSPKTERNLLKSGTGVVEFHFTAFNFTAPDKIKLLYMLENYDKRWKTVPTRQKRMAFYLNLPDGNYRFRVAAGSHTGAWNTREAYFDFTIGSPMSRFYIGFLIIFFVLAPLAAWFVIRRSRRKKTKLKSEKPGETVWENEMASRKEGKDRETKKYGEGKYKTSALLKETIDQVLPRLQKLMEEDHIYLDPDLNLKKLSEMLNVHYNHLSQIINEQLKKSFNDYINGFRIEAAKKKLADPSQFRKTILEIAYDTGFYSKSVFNTAFKKFTGCTPSQFRNDRKC